MLRRAIVQAGVLGGIGLGLFVGPERPAGAGPICVNDPGCKFPKPMFLFALDYSTAMNVPHGQQGTRATRRSTGCGSCSTRATGSCPGAR